MRFRIHFTLPDGSEDSVVVEDETIEGIRKKAMHEVDKRGGENPWSEML